MQRIKVKSNPSLSWAWPSSVPACFNFLPVLYSRSYSYQYSLLYTLVFSPGAPTTLLMTGFHLSFAPAPWTLHPPPVLGWSVVAAEQSSLTSFICILTGPMGGGGEGASSLLSWWLHDLGGHVKHRVQFTPSWTTGLVIVYSRTYLWCVSRSSPEMATLSHCPVVLNPSDHHQ